MTGLVDVVLDGVITAFDVASDFVEDIVYVRVASTEYNTQTSRTEPVEQQVPMRGLKGDFNIRQIDGSAVLPGDILFFIPWNEIPVEGGIALFEPKPRRDYVVRGYDQKRWGVVDYKKDPAGALLSLQLRKETQ